MAMPKIIFVPFPVGAYGHQIADSEQLLWNLNKLSQDFRVHSFGIFLSRPANTFHAQMLKREIRILPKIPFLFIHRMLCRFSTSYRNLDKNIQERGINLYSELMNNSPSAMANAMTFEDEEKELYEFFGSAPKIALLVCRDSGYDDSLGYQISMEREYRNSDTKIFRNAIEFLRDEGYAVIRLGRHNKTERHRIEGLIEIQDIPSLNPDRMDFSVAKMSDFIISTGSGPDTLGMFFRKPIYFVNAPTIGFSQSNTIRSWFLKRIISGKMNREFEAVLDFEQAKLYLFDELLLRDEVLNGNISVKSRNESEILEHVKQCLENYRGLDQPKLAFIRY